MPVNSSTNILTLSNTQAKELAGRVVIIGGGDVLLQQLRSGPPRPAPVAFRGGGKGLSAAWAATVRWPRT